MIAAVRFRLNRAILGVTETTLIAPTTAGVRKQRTAAFFVASPLMHVSTFTLLLDAHNADGIFVNSNRNQALKQHGRRKDY